MIDIAVDPVTEDFIIIDGVPQTVEGVDQVCQAVRLTLKAFQGEWFIDLAYGVPWYTRVLGHRFSGGQIALTVSDAILSVPGVAAIEDIRAVKTGEREATVTADILTDQGAQATVTAQVP